MPRLRYLTAGESHGEMLVGILEGMPAGVSISIEDDIAPILALRRSGTGRSARQKFETDDVRIVSGVRFGYTTGAPIAVLIANNEWDKWKERMAVFGEPPESLNRISTPRPGHSDFAGAIKYGQTDDLRNAFERSSARETAIRTALGCIASALLRTVGITSISYITSIGKISTDTRISSMSERDSALKKLLTSDLRCFDPMAEQEMIKEIEDARSTQDTLGGTVESIFFGVPVGIGSMMHWDRKLDSQLAASVMSIQAVKAVEIGLGKDSSMKYGSEVHDEFVLENNTITRTSNNAGGLEGGMSNGMPIVVRATMKPISTTMKPLKSVDLKTMRQTSAHIERSDVCAVPALSVIVEQIVSLTIADALLDTFGGDTADELRERIEKRRNLV